MENQAYPQIKLLILIGVLVTVLLAVIIILFVIYYQRQILIKEAKMHLFEQERQIELFKASVEAEELEKEKIARNLHDEINPILAVLKLNLKRHRIEYKKNNFDSELFETDESLIDKAIQGIRTTCFELIPSFLLEYGLIKSLDDYVRGLNHLKGIETYFESFEQTNNLDLYSKQEQLNIYRICLEISNNIFKHDHCSWFKISVFIENSVLIILFSHNGEGISNEEINYKIENSKGIGLKSLQARSLLLNAKINYSKKSNEHKDCASVTLTIPLS